MCYAVMAHVTDYDVWHETEEAVNVAMLIENLTANAALTKQAVGHLVGQWQTSSARAIARMRWRRLLSLSATWFPKGSGASWPPSSANYLPAQNKPRARVRAAAGGASDIGAPGREIGNRKPAGRKHPAHFVTFCCNRAGCCRTWVAHAGSTIRGDWFWPPHTWASVPSVTRQRAGIVRRLGHLVHGWLIWLSIAACQIATRFSCRSRRCFPVGA